MQHKDGRRVPRLMASSSPIVSPNYRPDIDGLRAVAVLPVVAFHAFPGWVTGGFIGVDVFFVISGFLISTLIYQNIHAGRFTFYEFYARRIRRIFPGLLLVVVASYGLGWIVLLADEYKELGKHTFAAAAFLANFSFWAESGYFDSAGEIKPLLHLWSLGIEEQFYILWPLLVYLAWKKQVWFVVGTVLLLLASLYASLAVTERDAVAAFYSPQTRFWELLCGSLLAWVVMNRRNASGGNELATIDARRSTYYSIAANLLSVLGLSILVWGFLYIDKEAQFPGPWAAVPVLGAVAAILAGPDAWLNRCVLSNRVAVGIGLISFPLYLWHWPLLSFARIVASDDPGWAVKWGIVAASLMLAWLTYRGLERPIRFGSGSNAKVLVLSGLMAVVGVIGFGTYFQDGLRFRNKDRQEFIDHFENNVSEWRFPSSITTAGFRHECNFYDVEKERRGEETNAPRKEIAVECFVRDHSKPKAVFVWGDSHAQQLYYGLKQEMPDDWQILQVATSGCAVENGGAEGAEGQLCKTTNEFARRAIKEARPDVVVISQLDPLAAVIAAAFEEELKSLGVPRVIFVGPVPRWTADLPKIIARQLWFFTPRRTLVGVDKSFMELNDELKADYQARGLNYVDVISLFCDGGGCLTRLTDDRVEGATTLDYGHLLPIASDYLAKRLLVPTIVGVPLVSRAND